MKKRFCAFLCVILVICAVLPTGIFVSAAETIAGNRSVDGVAYKLIGDERDENAYYTVVGYSEEFPKLTIVNEIDGIPVTVITESAFVNNQSLTEISIPASVTTIEKAAFRHCKNLVTVTLSASLTSIPEECFYDCVMLKNIVFPNKLVSIGDRAFYNCTMLKDVKIPRSVTEIGYDAFHGCESIVFDASENEYAAQYAVENNINTDFKNTGTYFLLMMLLGTVVATVLFLIIAFFMRKHIKKHPSHNPGIYIEKFFIGIGKFFGFIFGKIEFVLKLIGKYVSILLNRIGELMRARRLKKAEKKAQKMAKKEEEP